MILLHIFYKEWIKTRWALLLTTAVGVATVWYIFMAVANRMTMLSAKIYWSKVLYDTPPLTYYSLLLYIPTLIALGVGLSQYLPEVMQKRIRLTLHLPLSSTRAIVYMAIYGIVTVTLANVAILALFWFKNNALFPDEITTPVMVSLLPWFLAAYPTYNFVAMIAMEPNLWRQVIYALVGYIIVSQFFVVGEAHGAYANSLPVFLIISLCTFPMILYTAHRFNKGEK